MKKRLFALLSLILGLGLLAGCGSATKKSDESATSTKTASEATTSAKEEGKTQTIDRLKLSFVPSREPNEIITATEPLKGLLKEEMGKLGYTVNNVDINVGTTYEAVGEGLDSGTVDIGLGMPGGTYVLYDKGADVILTATRAGLSKDSEQAKDWNDGKATETSDKQAVSYRALFIAGPSEKGKALAEKVNKGEQLSWEDLNAVNWSIMDTTSSAGYIYPTLWLQKNFQKGVSDLANKVKSDSYGSAFARLASGQVDALVTYADARRDFEKKWTSEYGRKEEIWNETNVIAVTPPIYNDTICVSKNSKTLTPEIVKALKQAFINIGKSEAGKKVIAIYSHQGYQEAQSSDYDNEREAQKLVQTMKK